MSAELNAGFIKFASSASGGNTLLNGLLAFWKMNESASPIADEVGTNDGVAASTAATYSQSGPSGMGNSILFNYTPTYGYGTRFDVGDDILQSNQLSVSAWIYPTEGGDRFCIVSNGYSNTHGWNLYCGGSGGGVAADVYNGSGQSRTIDSLPTYTMTGSTWYHVVWVVDGTNSTIYVNTTQWATGAFAYNIGYGTNSALTIGANQDNSNSFGGRIVGLGLWDRALTSGERSSLYASGNGITYPF